MDPGAGIPRRWLVTAVILLVLAASAGLAWYIIGADPGPTPAETAALHQWRHGQAEVEDTADWDRCAVIQLQDKATDAVISMVVVKQNDRWTVRRTTSTTVHFDPADVIDEADCMDIARSN